MKRCIGIKDQNSYYDKGSFPVFELVFQQKVSIFEQFLI